MAITQKKIDDLKASIPSEIDDLTGKIKKINSEIEALELKKHGFLIKQKELRDDLRAIEKLEKLEK